MIEHEKLAKKAIAVLDQIEITYGDPHDELLQQQKRKQLRSVGETLNKAGGFELMLIVCEAMKVIKAKGQTNLVNREIEISWDGIGDWQG